MSGQHASGTLAPTSRRAPGAGSPSLQEWLGRFARLRARLPTRLPTRLPEDARVYQILFLASFLTIGVLTRDFTLWPMQMALTFAAGVATQAFFIHRLEIRNVGYLSAIVTCFGLSLLLRADSLWVHPAAAALAIGAKFVVRYRGKHIFNPANLGVMFGLLIAPGAWTSPGQWGSDLVLFGWFIALGMVVTARARRFDVSLVFLATYAGLLAGRIAWLEQSWSVFTHQINSGALLLFTFFMISDPMTTPNARLARIIFAMIVALGAFSWQFGLHRPNALVWALFLSTPLVLLFDRLLPAAAPRWRSAAP